MVIVLVFKLLVTPLLLLTASLAGRRWGDAIGSLLVGMPLTSGPISVFPALEHGPAFAAQAAFCIAYCRLAILGWPTALAGGFAIFSVVATVPQWSALPHTGLFLCCSSQGSWSV
ncbi:hypothetical protein OKW40_006109 [Paraburkholderia sp. RAU6.4a]|uniref:hypothetical protein n=1 Tax=Paraburkholderia sp. RAU6.4a TaxID=2991067 RepID=UPI003D19AA2F